ncbi:MAG: hypothetical protein BWX54_02143 [Verrucomicrobia bacterium ADurb.Bin018]|nr:MAG: hypothetical protein BWX54_02143 [Verrucomicrobia bacterium ADurb.Bin018]
MTFSIQGHIAATGCDRRFVDIDAFKLGCISGGVAIADRQAIPVRRATAAAHPEMTAVGSDLAAAVQGDIAAVGIGVRPEDGVQFTRGRTNGGAGSQSDIVRGFECQCRIATAGFGQTDIVGYGDTPGHFIGYACSRIECCRITIGNGLTDGAVRRVQQPESAFAPGRFCSNKTSDGVQCVSRGFNPAAVAACGAAFGLKRAIGTGNGLWIGDVGPCDNRATVAVIGSVGLQCCAGFNDRFDSLADFRVLALPAAAYQHFTAAGCSGCGQQRAGFHQHPVAGGHHAAALGGVR